MNKHFYQTLLLSSIVMLLSACQGSNFEEKITAAITTSGLDKEYLITVTRPDTTVHIVDLQFRHVINNSLYAPNIHNYKSF